MSDINSIYSNQEEASNNIVSKFLNEKHQQCLLIAEPQSGKTGCLIDVTYQFLKKHNNVCYTNIYIPSATELRDQTKERFGGKYIRETTSSKVNLGGDRVKIYYPANLHHEKSQKEFSNSINNCRKNIEFDEDGCLLHIHDEAHRDVSKKGVFNKTFKVNNIPYLRTDSDLTDHFNSYEYTLLCTATPSPQIEYAKNFYRLNKELPFGIVYLKAGDSYLSLKDLKNQNRIKQSFKIYDKEINNFKKFEKEVLFNFLNEDPGYGILRLPSMFEYNLIKNDLKKYYPNIDVNIYNCENNNIDELDETIQKETNKHHICVIIDSYLQGKTFESLKNIRFWFDTYDKSGNNDAFVAQSVGRNCGYNGKNTKYPIFTDIKTIDNLIKFYDLIKNIDHNEKNILDIPPITGSYIKINVKETNNSKTNWIIVCHDSLEERNNCINLKNKLGYDPSELSDGLTLSKNANDPIIKNILNKSFKHLGGSRTIKRFKEQGKTSPIYQKHVNTIFFDNPNINNKEDIEYWNKYVINNENEEFEINLSNYQNKYITFFEDTSLDDDNDEIIRVTKKDKSSLYSNKLNESKEKESIVAIKQNEIQIEKEINEEINEFDDFKNEIENHVLKYFFQGNEFKLEDKYYVNIYLLFIKHVFSNLTHNEKNVIINELKRNKMISYERDFFVRKNNELIHDVYIRSLEDDEKILFINTNNCTGRKDKNLKELIKIISSKINIQISNVYRNNKKID